MRLLDTKLVIADALCKTGQLAKLNKVGRPSNANLQQIYENKRKKGPTNEIPQEHIRKDGFDHFHIGRREIDQDVNTLAAQERVI
nr:unnamed protein product [Callosobruchus analis]